MPTPHEILRQFWGYDQFRLSQEEIVQSLIAGKDTLALLPTGGGKSICFQVPALCMEGICIVVSPLVALMQDQVRNLTERGIPAVALTSMLSHREMDRLLDNSIYGNIRFLYVSPERLSNPLFIERFKRMKVSMIAVDEAHCISQWGYDFRPAYLEIARIREWKPGVPVLALTASATPPVVADIQDKLAFRQHHVIASSFARSNLGYIVLPEENKEQRLIHLCRTMKGSGIVYCATRLRTREIAQLLTRQGIRSGHYHAGLSHAERARVFQQWMNNEVRIICATNAFGMGIDKPDVRFVIHADVPASIEAYFQEAGRAGRDGQDAWAVLLWHPSDAERIVSAVAQKFPPRETIARVYGAIGDMLQLAIGAGKDQSYPFDITAFSKSFSLPLAEVVFSLQLLEKAGYLTLSDAVAVPSRLMIIVGRQQLYSFQVIHENLDAFIRTLLRMYGGLFEQHCPIREEDIARATRLSVRDVRSRMEVLVNKGIVDYVPRSDQPWLTMTLPRAAAKHVLIPPAIYEQRQRTENERAEAMVRFLQRDRCRSVQLLQYFGEKDPPACGRCDVCRAQLREGKDAELFETISRLLEEVAIARPMTLDELILNYPGFPRERLLETARWKIERGELALDRSLRLVMPGLDE